MEDHILIAFLTLFPKSGFRVYNEGPADDGFAPSMPVPGITGSHNTVSNYFSSWARPELPSHRRVNHSIFQ